MWAFGFAILLPVWLLLSRRHPRLLLGKIPFQKFTMGQPLSLCSWSGSCQRTCEAANTSSWLNPWHTWGGPGWSFWPGPSYCEPLGKRTGRLKISFSLDLLHCLPMNREGNKKSIQAAKIIPGWRRASFSWLPLATFPPWRMAEIQGLGVLTPVGKWGSIIGLSPCLIWGTVR